jgi:putative FmdB family regulatory protein
VPIYTYQCEACGMRFDRRQQMSEPPLTECPECEGPVHRVIHPVGIIFKGSGFYVTDNRQGSSSTLGTAGDSAGDRGRVEKKSGEEGATAPESTTSDSSDEATD